MLEGSKSLLCLVIMGGVMKPKYFLGLPFLISCLFSGSVAEASVFDVFTVESNPITAGSDSTIQLQLTVEPDPGYYDAVFDGGVVTISSGTGSVQSFSIAPGESSEEFTAIFTYPLSGDFHPSFWLTDVYSEKYSKYCGRSFCDVDWQKVDNGDKTNVSFLYGASNIRVEADPKLDPTPLPPAWSLALLGFVGLGSVLGWTRAS